MTELPNYTFVFYLRLLRDCTIQSDKRYVFDTGQFQSNRNKISLFVQGDNLVFQAIDRGSIFYATRTSAAIYEKDFKLIFCELESSEKESIIRLRDESLILSENSTGFPLIFTPPPLNDNYFIGASVDGRDFGCFEISEQLIYSNVLSNSDRNRLINYFKQKYSGESFSKIQFKNGAYIYRNAGDKNLIQPAEEHQPKFFNN